MTTTFFPRRSLREKPLATVEFNPIPDLTLLLYNNGLIWGQRFVALYLVGTTTLLTFWNRNLAKTAMQQVPPRDKSRTAEAAPGDACHDRDAPLFF